MSILLKAVELPYRGINRLRRLAYQQGVLKARRLPKPVISVGNISAGGAGKTPAVIAIAQHLNEQGLHVGVLTRGYGRAGEGGVVDDLDAARFGDEPVLIKKYTTNTSVIVGVNRYDNAVAVNCDCYLLDDGFQHLQLHRDLDVVIDAPGARFLREGRSALRFADIVLPRRIRPRNVDGLRGRNVFAFAGLADNEQFFAMLRDNGAVVKGTRSFPDHHDYSAADVGGIRAAAREAELIVTTEKDSVKLGESDIIAVRIEFLIEPAVLEQIATVARG